MTVIDTILSKAPVYLLVFARCFVMLLTLPLFSMRAAVRGRSVPRVANVALAGYMSFFILTTVDFSYYSGLFGEDGVFSLIYILVLLGEAAIGLIMGFYVTVIFAAFSSAGQFAAFQMGFSAASTYDALAQVENPLLGQFLNFAALFVFLQTKWFQRLFLGGLVSSFKTLTVAQLVLERESLVRFLLRGLSNLFSDALVIAFPIMGTLLLITICTGLLTKAAPQMNLLSEGFPIMILTSFLIIWLVFPSLIDFFERIFRQGFYDLQQLFVRMGGSI